MRIVAGKFRGRNLAKSDHLKSLRPTTDKNREALFNILFSAKFIREVGFDLTDAAVLDVCCGSGAVAFEALSRGAKSATLLDNSAIHLDLARENARLLGVENDVKILFADTKRLPRNEIFFNLIFIDPPYSVNYSEILKNLLNTGWIKKESLIVVEFDSITLKKNPEHFSLESFDLLDLRDYGKTSFAFLLLK